MDDLKRKILQLVSAALGISGFVVFALSMLNVIQVPDIVELYSLCCITGGVFSVVLTIKYYEMTAELQERIKRQHQILLKKAFRDSKREERKYQKSMR